MKIIARFRLLACIVVVQELVNYLHILPILLFNCGGQCGCYLAIWMKMTHSEKNVGNYGCRCYLARVCRFPYPQCFQTQSPQAIVAALPYHNLVRLPNSDEISPQVLIEIVQAGLYPEDHKNIIRVSRWTFINTNLIHFYRHFNSLIPRVYFAVQSFNCGFYHFQR